jgi:Tfp pilus assembly protein PilF
MGKILLAGRLLGVLLAMSLLPACSMVRLELPFAADKELEASILNQREDAFPDLDAMALDQQIIDYLEANVTDRSSDYRIVDRLQELLFSEGYLNLQYDDLRTRTAVQTFEDRQGNCLSVVSLYIAMARHFGVDAQFQTVKVRPSWDRRGEHLVLSQHINAIGRLGQDTQYVVDFTPEITLQQLTANRVSDSQARALYFNNLGVESLIANELDKATAYFRNALFIDPELSIVWNNIGSTYSRQGNKDLAEYSYLKAFALDRSNATAINNLVKFHTARGDVATAERYAKAIERFNNSNPYFHYNLGNVAYAEGNFEMARMHYERAIRRKESEPDFYLALSKTYEMLGDMEQSELQLGLARVAVLNSDQLYLPSRNKVRVVDEKSILRSSSAGFSVRANPL